MARLGLFFLVVVLFFVGALSGCAKTVSDIQLPATLQAQPLVSPTLTFKEISVDFSIRPMDEMRMIYVPSGTFQLGSTESDVSAAIALCQDFYHTCNHWYYARESPQHSVSLDSFWIDQTEVSNTQYRLCVDDGNCAEPVTCKKGEPTFDDPNKTDHPIVCVNWGDAQNYCQWAGARLPTEAEWEYAFRGEIGATYPWGDEFDGSRLNYCDQNCSETHADTRFDDGYSQTAPVGSYRSGTSWSGVLNMSGNVSEWVADWMGTYSPEAAINPSGPANGNEKMIKGCSWFFHPTYCRGAARPATDPDTRFNYLGFRCASSDLSRASSNLKPNEEPESTPETTPTETASSFVLPVPEGTLGDVWGRPSDGMPMIYVAGEIFYMGGYENDPDVTPAELPQHEVELNSFWIDRTEVSNAQYKLCVEIGACKESLYANDATDTEDDYPVVGVAWQDAVDYCTWIGGRLPTEAEWEYAAKGKEGFLFPWGNEFNGNLVNSCDANCSESWADSNFDDGFRESAPVDSYPDGASWVGALNMAGNVWEWVGDWCGEYSSDAQINPDGPENGRCKIIRGGAWASPPDGIRTTYRIVGSSEITPQTRHPNIGFRCIALAK